MRSVWVLVFVVLLAVLAFAAFVIRAPTIAASLPDFSRQTGTDLVDWKYTSIVVCRATTELNREYERIDHDLAKHVAYEFNGQGIKVIDPQRVSEWLEKQGTEESQISSSDIGAAFRVDFVIHVELKSFNISKEPGDAYFRGSAQAVVTVVKMHGDKSRGSVIYTKEIDHRCPVQTPDPAYELSYAKYKSLFLSALGNAVGRLFYVRVDESLLDPVFEDCLNAK